MSCDVQPIRSLAQTRKRGASPAWLLTGSNLEPRFGGIASVIEPLCRSVRETGGIRVKVAAFGSDSSGELLEGARPFPLSNRPWLTAREPWAELAAEIAAADGVHIHGVWQKHCALPALLARRAGKPYLISAHGMLDGWALGNKRWKKQLYSSLIERGNLRRAACLHALTRAEAEDYRKLAPGVPVAVIPNGVSIPEASPDEFLERFPALRGRRLVLFLGRIHYKKGLDLLCRAWARLANRWPDAELVLAGPDFEGTRSSVEALAGMLGIHERVTFTGMLAGPLKWSALAASEIFVLPSYSEGLSVSVLEAMGMGLPVVITRQCNLPEAASHGCGWVIEPETGELERALNEALEAPPSLRARVGRKCQALVQTRYSWPVVGARMASVYGWLSGGSKPSQTEIL